MDLDRKITRHFTTELSGTNKTVYQLFKWKKVHVQLTNYATGAIISDLKDLEFPEAYSQSACDIIASKYFRKKGVPNDRGCEYSMRQLTHRMVSFWVEALYDEVMIGVEQKQVLYDELAYMLLAQIWAPNSPQWFNTGLQLAYQIAGPAQGHYYFDEESASVVQSKDAYTRTQGSACFIISVIDSLIGEKSLTDQLITETLLFKFGSGVGTNWSPIRGRNESLSGGGKSSGLMSFLKVSDRNAGAIKSGGTTRRAAKMNILNLDHPEILDFIAWKAEEEEKAAALGKMGYSTTMDGEAYDTVSGQNANNSIRIPDSFMRALQDPNSLWKTTARVDPVVDGEIKVSELWEQTAAAAWRCGDPGVQFDDTINAWHTCPCGEDGVLNAPYNRVNASNPCAEYMFLDDTACNLASINIVAFYNGTSFDTEGYVHAVKMIQLALEATIHWGQFPTKDIAKRSYQFRTTGLGLANLGTLFMHMGIPYDSEEARAVGAALCSIMTGYSYYTSALMAEKVGPFPCYEKNKPHMQRVIRNHARAAAYRKSDVGFEGIPYTPFVLDHGILENMGLHNIAVCIKDTWENAIAAGRRYGYRNAQVTALAPTGTIAFAMDCASTSSEPFFSHVAYKKLVGGGFMEIVNPAIQAALHTLGYDSDQMNDIIGYVLARDENGTLKDGKIEGAPHLRPEHYPIFDTANKCGTGERYICPEGHIMMVAALTPHITGAISKTVNLPRNTSVEDIGHIYQLAWESGVKAVALYRDGCKVCQPLSTAIEPHKEKPLTGYSYQELIDYIHILEQAQKPAHAPLRVKPSGIRTARVHEAAINGLKLYITTSFYEDGRLGEIYVSSGRQGSLTKGLLDSVSTTLSEMLQYGVPPQDIARMYRGQKYEPSGFVSGHPFIKSVDSISDLISKIIDIELGNYTYCQVKPPGWQDACATEGQAAMDTHYTPTDYIYSEACPHCKSIKMVKSGTCKVCVECGTTTGCS